MKRHPKIRRRVLVGVGVAIAVLIALALSVWAAGKKYTEHFTKKSRKPTCSSIPEGAVVRCEGPGFAVFKKVGGALRKYDKRSYAAAGSPSAAVVPCAAINACPRGPPFVAPPPKPACSITDGAIVQCPGQSATYAMRGGVLRQYDWGTWNAEGKPAPAQVPCGAIDVCPKGSAYAFVPTAPPPQQSAPWVSTSAKYHFDFTTNACNNIMVDPNGFNTAISDALCAQLGVPGAHPGSTTCGRSLKVRNNLNGKQIVVKIVDFRGNDEGLDLQAEAFQALDDQTYGPGTGRGNDAGRFADLSVQFA